MVEHIPEDDAPKQDPAETETTFNSLSNGDEIVVFAWGGGDEYIKATFTVSRVEQDTSENDDYALGQSDGQSAKLRLPWYPAEPNVGIPRPYSELPVRFEYNGETYDVLSLQD